MGHYWSEMRGPETQLEKDQNRAKVLVAQLRALSASRFTVDELALLLRCGWSEFKTDYHDNECGTIFALAVRELDRKAGGQ